jgi:hypothetical protein
MTKTTHTPGPWSTGANSTLSIFSPIVNGAYKTTVAEACTQKIGIEEAEANAKLIAAAPDLLQALIEVKRIGGFGSDGTIGQTINAAIKKATIIDNDNNPAL